MNRLRTLELGVLGVLLYTIPVLGILLVLPDDKITGIGGFVDAVKETFANDGPGLRLLRSLDAARDVVWALPLGYFLTKQHVGRREVIGAMLEETDKLARLVPASVPERETGPRLLLGPRPRDVISR